MTVRQRRRCTSQTVGLHVVNFKRFNARWVARQSDVWSTTKRSPHVSPYNHDPLVSWYSGSCYNALNNANCRHCRGRHRRGCWVFGLVECVTENMLAWNHCPSWHTDTGTHNFRNSDHLLPGTIVSTDAWAVYANVSTINNGVYNQVVVHAQHFVDPVHDAINTQTIEGLWMHAKRKLRFRDVTKFEFEFECCRTSNVFDTFAIRRILLWLFSGFEWRA